MTILHLVQKPQLRGAEMFAAQLASHNMRSGHKSLLVFLYPGSAELPFAGATYTLNSRKWRRYADVAAWWRLANIIRRENPDVIQANAGDTLKVAVLSKCFFRWKQPIVFRNASTLSLYIKSGLSRKWNEFFFRRADRIISVCHASANDFASLYPSMLRRVITIPIGIEYFEVNETKPAGRRNEYPTIVHVGGFTYEKNHVRLINIFERILQHLPNARLQLIGDGPLRKEIEAIVHKRSLHGRVHFFGFRSDAIDFIAGADVLVLPSVIEGLPAVITEAFYCATPVVAYDVGGVSELVEDGYTGRLIPAGHEAAFAKAVVHTLEGGAANEQMVHNAKELVTREYLNYRLAWRFAEEYQTLKNDRNQRHTQIKWYQWKY